MAHGYPDWGGAAPVSTVYSIQDLGELAARLGSIVTFDRRGNVVWIDDFESGIGKWSIDIGGTGASAGISAARSRNGAFSAKLVAGSDGGRSVALNHRMPYPVLSRIGSEFSFTIDGNQEVIRDRLTLHTGALELNAIVQYRYQDKTIVYYDSEGYYSVFASNVKLYAHSYLFNTIKVVADFVNQKYIRLVLNERVYDMSNLALHPISSTTTPHIYSQVFVGSKVGTNSVSYIDDSIITQNEP